MNAAKKRYFTVAEASRRLPLVRSIVSDIVELYRDVHDRRQRLSHIRERPGQPRRSSGTVYSEELDQMEEQLERDAARLEEFIAELEDLGAELKDPYTGLVDFRTWVDGREVCLCWQLGEDEIGHWHEVDTGYGGRQSLLEGSLFTDTE